MHPHVAFLARQPVLAWLDPAMSLRVPYGLGVYMLQWSSPEIFSEQFLMQ